jgi:hypothetical protein
MPIEWVGFHAGKNGAQVVKHNATKRCKGLDGSEWSSSRPEALHAGNEPPAVIG